MDWFTIGMFALSFLLILLGWAVRNGNEEQHKNKQTK